MRKEQLLCIAFLIAFVTESAFIIWVSQDSVFNTYTVTVLFITFLSIFIIVAIPIANWVVQPVLGSKKVFQPLGKTTVSNLTGDKKLNDLLFFQSVNNMSNPFFDLLPMGVIIVEQGGKLFYINQFARSLLDGTLQIPIPPTVSCLARLYPVYLTGSQLSYPVERDPIISAFKGVSTNLDDMEIRNIEKTISLAVWGTPIFNEQGKIHYAMVTFQDITERREAEDNIIHFTEDLHARNTQLESSLHTLQENENRLVQFLEAIPVGVGILDSSGQPYYINQKAQELLGRGIVQDTTVEQLRDAYKIYITDTHCPENPSMCTLQNPKVTIDAANIQSSEQFIPIEVWETPIFDEAGNLAYTVTAFQDITLRKQAEEIQQRYTKELAELTYVLEQKVIERTNALEKQTQEAIYANQAKSHFLAAASHDLRQPLHALSLFVDALNSRVTDPDSRTLIDKIQLSIMAMTAQFNALLDISRLDAGIITPNIKSFSLSALLERLQKEFNSQAKEKSLSFILDIQHAYYIHSDPILLESVLKQLLSNAFKFTQTGEIRLSCYPLDHQIINKTSVEMGAVDPLPCKWINVIVSDTGIGIPQDQHQAIFLEFHQLHNPARDRAKGFGLGLSIVKRLAKLLNHPLSMESTLGQGSQFILTVPIAEKNSEEQVINEFDFSSEELEESCFGYVLLIDDEQSIRQATSKLLIDWGYHVVTADSGEKALQKIVQMEFIPDVILADYRLREEETGIYAIQKVQTHLGKAVPGILITGDTAPERLKEAQESGYKLLHKPIKPAHLRKLIGYYVRQKKGNSA